MTLAGVAIVILQFWREVGPLRAEVRRLHRELGELIIEDDSKMHAVYRKTYQEKTWRWRVFLPEEARYVIYFSANQVPRDAFPERPYLHGYGFGPARYLPVKGEYEVTIAIREDEYR